MQGRLENELKIQRNTEVILSGLPYYVNEWCMNMRASKKTASTIRDYVIKIKRFLTYIDDNVKDISPEKLTLQACESYIISCQTKRNDDGMEEYTSDSYQLVVYCALNSFFGFMVKRQYLAHNPMNEIEKPRNRDFERNKNTRKYLTQRDFNKILDTIKNENFHKGKTINRDILMMLIFMTTGIRATALMEINISDIDTILNTLTVVDKGNRTHTYYLNEETMKYLTLWLTDRVKINGSEGTDALFITRDGKRISQKNVSSIVERCTKRALGVAFSPHKLRAGFCSILYNKTHDAEFVRRAVGHRNIQTTQRYIKTGDEEKEKAMRLMSEVFK